MTKLDFCRVRLEPDHDNVDGYVGTVRYHWEGYQVNGSDTLEDVGADWSDDDVRKYAAEIVGIEGDDVARIEVEWV